jgi:hypothetical protein
MRPIPSGLSANRKLSGFDGGISPLKSASRQRLSVAASAFYKGEGQEKKHLWRLEGAGLFAVLSSPWHVERLWGSRSS